MHVKDKRIVCGIFNHSVNEGVIPAGSPLQRGINMYVKNSRIVWGIVSHSANHGTIPVCDPPQGYIKEEIWGVRYAQRKLDLLLSDF